MQEYKILRKAKTFKVSISFEIPGTQEDVKKELQEKLWLLTQTRGYSLRRLVQMGIDAATEAEGGG